MTVDCVLKAGAEVGESPVWCAREAVLWWIDIVGKSIHRFEPASGIDRSWPAPGRPGAIGLRESGGLVVAMEDGFQTFDAATGVFTPVAIAERGKPGNRLNDGRCDRKGRFWSGSMADPPHPPTATGALYRLEPDGHVATALAGLIVSNGLAFSPDDLVLYVGDTSPTVRTIWAFDFDLAAGTIANRRVFVDTHAYEGRPDGGTVDAEGCYWMTATDGWALLRFTPVGKLDRRIMLPIKKPTMPAFGGPGLETLFVTSLSKGQDLAEQPLAGGIFAIAAGVKGVPEPRFAG
jgi:sugar lactone lactonase YvrE